MLRSAASFIILFLVAIQAAVASIIKPGIYLIQDLLSHLYLGIGPVPIISPGVDFPVRLVPERIALKEGWIVKEGENGGIIITTGRGRPDDYKIVYNDNDVMVSAQKAPETWDALQVGGGPLVVEIKLPYKDKVITANKDEYSVVSLQSSKGQDNQHFRFIPVERGLYHRNRFAVQDSC